jgi:hypothetical protein
MANKVQILNKLQRNLTQLGLTINSNDGVTLVVENGANDLSVTYVDAVIARPMAGVDPTVPPFLGIGTANPGQIKITSAGHGAVAMSDILDTAIAAQVFAECMGFANDVLLSNDYASFTAVIRASADLRGLGQ